MTGRKGPQGEQEQWNPIDLETVGSTTAFWPKALRLHKGSRPEGGGWQFLLLITRRGAVLLGREPSLPAPELIVHLHKTPQHTRSSRMPGVAVL